MTFLQRKNKGVFLFRTFFVAGLLLTGAVSHAICLYYYTVGLIKVSMDTGHSMNCTEIGKI